MTVREEDAVSQLFVASTHSYVLIFSDRGRVYWLRVHEIPSGRAGRQGHSTSSISCRWRSGEKIRALLTVREWPEEEERAYIVMGTRKGIIKKTDLAPSATSGPAASSPCGVDDDDTLIDAQLTDGASEILLGDARRHGHPLPRRATCGPMGRTAYGVRGIELREGDQVVAMAVAAGRAGRC